MPKANTTKDGVTASTLPSLPTLRTSQDRETELLIFLTHAFFSSEGMSLTLLENEIGGTNQIMMAHRSALVHY